MGKKKVNKYPIAFRKMALERLNPCMREDHLMAIEPKAFIVTTDSVHELEVSTSV